MVSTFFCTFAPIIKMFGTMKQRIYKLLLIYVVLVAIFALQHPVFIACYHSLFRGVGLGGVCAATWHGLRMDMAMAGYLAIVPGLLAAASVWTAGRAMRYAACIYSAVAAAVVSLSFVVDLCLKWIWVPMYAAVLFAVVRNYRWRQTLAVLVCVALAITIADQVCATLIRPEVCRLRPSNPENPLSEMVHIVGGYRGGSYGFPSCHAANSFALASFLTLLFANRKLSLFIFAWAVLNSYSRVYLGVHYPGDLLVGAIIGTAAGLAMAFAAGYVADRVDRPHLKPSVNTGVVTSVGAFTVAVIAVVSCFVRM